MAAAGVDDGVTVAAEEAPIYGDVLEAILSHVPLIDLVPAAQVSKSWSAAVSSSLRHINQPKPWLLIRTQSTRSPYATSARAYDPRSHVWVEISQPSIKYVSALRSSHSNLLYMLSPSKLSFSFDPLNLSWHHVDAPLVWRADPIVALVGDSIVIAGGACDFEDDPLAVEIYNVKSRTWQTCESMPSILRDSASSTWLSVAATKDRLFVMEKLSGVTHWFDPETKNWSEPYDLRPDRRIFHSVIGASNGDLILIGLIGEVEKVEGVKIWRMKSENFEAQEIGEMPRVFVEKLKSQGFGMSSISLCLAGNLGYLYTSAEAEEAVVCELRGGGCTWWSLRNSAAREGSRMDRVVFTCAEVGMDELERCMRCENIPFVTRS